MKKMAIFLTVSLGVVALGSIGAGAAIKKNVGTKASLSVSVVPPVTQVPPTPPDPYDPYDPGSPGTPGSPGSATFAGKVKPGDAKYGTCKKNRTVTVKRQGGAEVGTTSSDRTGEFSLTTSSKPPTGSYVASVKKKTKTKRGVKIVCKRKTTEPVAVP
jgi:hypothetical protein